MRHRIRSAKAWMMAPGGWELTDEQKREDAYWNPPQAPCIVCGDVDDLPKGVEYDEYVCGSCQRVGGEDAGH